MPKNTENGPEIGQKRGLRRRTYPITLSLLLVLQSCTKPPEKIYNLHQEIKELKASEKQQVRNIDKLTITINALEDTIQARENRGLDVTSEEFAVRTTKVLKKEEEKKLKETREEINNKTKEKDELEAEHPI